MKTLIYIRTSTKDQNPQNQLNDCLSINKYGDFHLVEEKQSAWKDKNRPEFEKIKQKIKQGKVKHLICWDWDRLFRNRKKLISFYQYCKLYDCEIHSFRQQYFEDFYKIPEPFDEMIQNLVLNLMGHMAEEESKKKSERVKIAYNNRKGTWGRKSLSKNVVEEVLNLHGRGKSIREIASSVSYWNKNNNKKQISKSAVHKIIQENTK